MDGPYSKAILVATGAAAATAWPWATPALNWALSPVAQPIAQEVIRTAASQAFAHSQWVERLAEQAPQAAELAA